MSGQSVLRTLKPTNSQTNSSNYPSYNVYQGTIDRQAGQNSSLQHAMKKKLIILVNRENLCAYSLSSDLLLSPNTAIEKINVRIEQHRPDPTNCSDNRGRFPDGSSIGYSSTMIQGEAHSRKTEKKKRQLSDLALTISKLVNDEDCDMWNLAIPADQANQVINKLPIDVQQKLTQLKEGDYTWLPRKEVERLFDT